MPTRNENSEQVLSQTGLSGLLERVQRQVSSRASIKFTGTVTSYDGQVIECSKFPASLGSQCTIKSSSGSLSKGELIGFRDDKNIIFQYNKSSDIFSGDDVYVSKVIKQVRVGPSLLGRVIDGLGQPLDGLGAIDYVDEFPIDGNAINPFDGLTV